KVEYFARRLAANLHNADRRPFCCFRRPRAHNRGHPEERGRDNPNVLSGHERRDPAEALSPITQLKHARILVLKIRRKNSADPPWRSMRSDLNQAVPYSGKLV